MIGTKGALAMAVTFLVAGALVLAAITFADSAGVPSDGVCGKEAAKPSPGMEDPASAAGGWRNGLGGARLEYLRLLRDCLASLEDLRNELGGMRRALAVRDAGEDAQQRPPTIQPPMHEDWSALLQAAERWRVAVAVVRHREALLQQILTGEAYCANPPPHLPDVFGTEGEAAAAATLDDLESSEEEDLLGRSPGAVAAEVEEKKRALRILENVRSMDELARWRHDFGIAPPRGVR